MEYLFDTQIILWHQMGDSRIGKKVRQAFDDPWARKYVSAASFWEMAIKTGTGKLSLDISIAEFWELLEAGGIEVLPLSPGQMTGLAALPAYHKDPFDRLIIAAAIEKTAIVISSDSIFAEYLPKDKILLV